MKNNIPIRSKTKKPKCIAGSLPPPFPHSPVFHNHFAIPPHPSRHPQCAAGGRDSSLRSEDSLTSPPLISVSCVLWAIGQPALSHHLLPAGRDGPP